MAFLTVVASSRVTVQQVQGRQRQSYSSTGYKSNTTSSEGKNASGQATVVKCYNYQGEGHMNRQCTQPKELAFLADPGVSDGQAAQKIIPNNASFQTEDLDTYDSDCDDISNAKAVLMAKISNYRSGFPTELGLARGSFRAFLPSDVISEVPHSETYLNDMENQSEHAMQDFEQITVVDVTDNEITSYQNLFYLKKTQRIKLTLYDGIVISNKHVAMLVIDDEETLISKEVSRSKIFKKKDPEAIKQNISHKPIDYVKLNKLYEDFGKRIVLQQELSADEAFWYHMLNSSTKSSDALPVKIEAPKELPKLSLVNESLKKLKLHLFNFDKVVKIRTTPNARTEGKWGFEHTTAIFNNEIIPSLKYLKDIFNVFDKDLLNKIIEVQVVFDQMDAAVQQSSVDKQCLEIIKKELLLENDRLLQQIMSQDVLLTVMKSMSLNGKYVNMERKRNESCDKCFNLDAELLKTQNAHNDLLKSYSQLEKHCISLELSNRRNQEFFLKDESCDIQNVFEILEYFENNDLKAQLQDKDTNISQIQDKVFMITSLKNDLRKLKRKEIVDNAAQIPTATTIVSGMFKLDLEPLAPKLLQNRETHIDYLKYTQEQADILQEIVKQSKAKQPLNNVLDFTWNHSQLMNFVSKFLGTVSFRNDHIARIIGYGDYQLGNVTISRVYYVNGLGRVDLLLGPRDTNLYTISLDDMLKTSSIYLLSKVLKTKSWLWHRWLSHLNFGTPNKLAKDGLARGIPRLKFQKDHLCSACALGKIPVAAAPRDVDLADSPVSTSIDQDAPSTSIPSTQDQEHSLIIYQGCEESPKTTHFHDDLLLESLHEDSTS
nr:hypothetical protein [Tanacetum cinerariifolium]